MQVLRDDVLDTVIRLAADPIPNIRFNVAKTLDIITTVMVANPEGQEVSKTTIMPILQQLNADNDADVRYFSGKAMEKCVSA